MSDSPTPRSHIQRWVTGILVGLPVLVCVTAGPPWSWYLLVSLVTMLALWEMHGLLFEAPLSSHVADFLFCRRALPAPWNLPLGNRRPQFYPFYLVFRRTFPYDAVLVPLIEIKSGALPCSLSHGCIYPISCRLFYLSGQSRRGDSGFYSCWWLPLPETPAPTTPDRVLAAASSIEIVSPKKTIEGAIGGLFSSVAAGSHRGLDLFEECALGRTALLQPCGRRYRTDRGPDRVHAEAKLRQEGFEHTPSGSRRYSGQAGLPDFLFSRLCGLFYNGALSINILGFDTAGR